MSYENNKIKYFLDRNSLIQMPSKTTPSVYYYFKYSSVRYSNHFTAEKTGCGQIQVIRTSKRVFILIPGESEYRILNEKTGFYLLRKLLKSDLRKKSGSSKEKQYQRFMKNKRRVSESKKIDKYLKSLKGENFKTLNMNSTCIGNQ